MIALLNIFLLPLILLGTSHSHPTCHLQTDVILGNRYLQLVHAIDASDCCDACYNFSGCVAFTFRKDNQTCYLKDNVHGTQRQAGHVSGTYASKTVATRACYLPGHSEYPFCKTSLPLEARISDLISRLKPEEKAPLLTARESPLGGIPRLGIPEYDWGTNCIHGVQSRCGSRCPTSFPNPNAQGAAWNRTLWQDMARVTGVELRALWLADYGENHDDNLPHLGLDCWSPNININRDPRWGRNLETPGEDPYLNGQYGSWHTKGLQQGEDKRYLQAIVTLKHWDAYSLEDGGGGKGAPSRHNFNAVVSSADLAGTYFPAFKTAVRDGNAKGVMCSYNAVNGVPSCASKFLLQDVLRSSWNFTGYVTSDSGAVEDIYAQHHFQNMSAEQGVAAAVKAGCDIDSSLDRGHASTGSPYTWSLAKALKAGLVQDADIDALLRRTFRMRFELGLFDPIEDQPYWHYTVEDKVDTKESKELNRLATRQGLVLLKNDAARFGGDSEMAAPALPLKPSRGKVAVIGPHAKATRALVGNYLGQICPDSQDSFACVETPAAAIARLNGGEESVVVVEGCSITGDSTSGFQTAVEAVSGADVQAVVMLMGLDTLSVEKEGHDRVHLGLPGTQLQLIQQVVEVVRGKKPVVVVMLNGGAVALDWLKIPGNTDAIIEAFYPGKLGSEAIADALFGVYSPGGKMPYSVMPSNYIEEVDFLNMSMTAGKGRTYRFYEGEPLWSFGFGLSYSHFTFSSVANSGVITLPTAYGTTSAPSFEIELRNDGNFAADEVVQAYFVPTNISLVNPAPLPVKQLFDFQRVSLAPGHVTKVSFQVPSASLALADFKGNLVSAPGQYKILFTNGVDQTVVKSMQLEGNEHILEPFPTSSSPTDSQGNLEIVV